jgi:branched-chain amino acid transport system ATP-binding protein
MTAILSVENLHVTYGTVEALKGVSLELNEGEIVTVLGANGAGKSTLLKAVSRLIPVKTGAMKLHDKIFNMIPAFEVVLKGISHCPEGRKVFSTLTVEENLNVGAYTRRKRVGEVRKAKERVFDLFPILKDRRKQFAGTLSGGEQQMMAIGRALMSDPRVLLLDEPSLGLAPLLVKHIFQIINEINSQGVSILLVEQNARKALSIANRGYVLETGKISISGMASELQQNAKVQEAYLGGTALTSPTPAVPS